MVVLTKPLLSTRCLH